MATIMPMSHTREKALYKCPVLILINLVVLIKFALRLGSRSMHINFVDGVN